MSARHRASPERNAAAERSSLIEPVDGGPEDGSKTVLKTVALSENELRAAAKLLNVLVGVEGDRGRELTRIVEKGGKSGDFRDRLVLVEHARQTFANRAQRSRFFHSAMFGEAAWDMLLALYATENADSRHTVSGLVNLAGVPPTTALRWLDFLEQEQLVTRKPNPTDRRVFYVGLTDMAREALDAYFCETVAT
jgi:DNA-binding MarR family transcriptional regulator